MSISSKVCKFLLFSLVQGTRFWFHKLKTSGTLLIIIICDVKVAYFFSEIPKFPVMLWVVFRCASGYAKWKIFFPCICSVCANFFGYLLQWWFITTIPVAPTPLSLLKLASAFCLKMHCLGSWQSPLIIGLADWRVALDLGSCSFPFLLFQISHRVQLTVVNAHGYYALQNTFKAKTKSTRNGSKCKDNHILFSIISLVP